MTNKTSLWACLAAAAFLAFQLLKAVYRLYFHPLSKFRGPRAAAVSRRWQANLVKTGSPETEYEKLHKAFSTCEGHRCSGSVTNWDS